MNSTQMILLSNNVSGRTVLSLLSNLYKFSCILSMHMPCHVLGLGFINAFKHDWEKTEVQLFTTSETLKKCAEVPRVPEISVPRKKAMVSFYAHPANDFSKSN